MADTEQACGRRIVLGDGGELVCNYEFEKDHTVFHCGDETIRVLDVLEQLREIHCKARKLKTDEESGGYEVAIDRADIGYHCISVFPEQNQAEHAASQLNEWLGKVYEARLSHFYDKYEVVAKTPYRIFLRHDGAEQVFMLRSRDLCTLSPFDNVRPGDAWYLLKRLNNALNEVCVDDYDFERFGFNRYSFSDNPPVMNIFFDDCGKRLEHDETKPFAPIRAHVQHHRLGTPETIYIYEDGDCQPLAKLRYHGYAIVVLQEAAKLNAMFDRMNAERLARREGTACLQFGFNRYSLSDNPPATNIFFVDCEKRLEHDETKPFAPIRAHVQHYKWWTPETIYIYEEGNCWPLTKLHYRGFAATVFQEAVKLNAMFDRMNAERLARREGAASSSECPGEK